VTPIFQIPDVKARGEGGLLGMALHPDFKTNPQVFVVYNYSNKNDYREKVVRYDYKEQSLVNPVIIIDNIDAAGIHNGSRLLFGPDKKLYITTGDAANQSQPQLVDNLNGKILRILPDGSIPADNPFKGNPVWSYGHRNPQGLVFIGNRLFSSEHGPSTDDEINIIEKGRNYGWPRVEGFCSGNERKFCEANNIKEPIKAWTPTIAVCGLDYYNHNRIPGWKNSLLLATLRGNELIQLKLNDDGRSITAEKSIFKDRFGRVRDICIAPDGKVYVCTGNGNNDKIIEIDK
jgi:glucose/arabinose dehydrogenase